MAYKSGIVVMGAGAWGTALAIQLARNNHQVHLYEPDAAKMQRIQQARCNDKYLPGILFPANITCYSDLALALDDINDVLIATPSHAFPAVLQQLQQLKRNDLQIICATKGLHPETSELLENSVKLYFPQAPTAVLSGPSFAMEVARQLPTAITLACNDQHFAEHVRALFHSDSFRVYLSDDMIGVQLCGAVKNVLAIATGISDGLGFGANTRAALITRGLAEMTRLGLAMGAKSQTFMGLAGMGDLVLTCTDNQSRNRRFGLAIGSGQTVAAAQQSIGHVVEGVQNVKQVLQLAAQTKQEMPISQQVQNILQGKETALQAVNSLMLRAPKQE